MNKFVFILFICYLITIQSFAEGRVLNLIYAERDTCTLSMDVYSPINIAPNRPCIIFVFGGGFIMGSKSEKTNVAFCKALSDSGFVVASIDYRLGLKGVKKVGVTNTKPLNKAINMAVEDLYSATNYLIQNAVSLNINPKQIIISGSSAGAITILHADYELSNRTKIANVLSPDFHYAGVMSFAGAILSNNGLPKYADKPAPTLFFHGTNDKLVTYNKLQVLKKGFFGSSAIAKQFKKQGFPYYIYRYQDYGHEICAIPMTQNLNEICSFIKEYIIKKRKLEIDVTLKDNDVDFKQLHSWTLKDLYK